MSKPIRVAQKTSFADVLNRVVAQNEKDAKYVTATGRCALCKKRKVKQGTRCEQCNTETTELIRKCSKSPGFTAFGVSTKQGEES